MSRRFADKVCNIKLILKELFVHLYYEVDSVRLYCHHGFIHLIFFLENHGTSY